MYIRPVEVDLDVKFQLEETMIICLYILGHVAKLAATSLQCKTFQNDSLQSPYAIVYSIQAVGAHKFCYNNGQRLYLIHLISRLNGPRREKTSLRGIQQSETQTSLISYRD